MSTILAKNMLLSFTVVGVSFRLGNSPSSWFMVSFMFVKVRFDQSTFYPREPSASTEQHTRHSAGR
jgi:hypothetical protein